jgi:hypothetical protein
VNDAEIQMALFVTLRPRWSRQSTSFGYPEFNFINIFGGKNRADFLKMVFDTFDGRQNLAKKHKIMSTCAKIKSLKYPANFLQNNL